MQKTCLMCGETYPDGAAFCPRDGTALYMTETADALIGELFCNRYVVTDRLGDGGMAEVYLARDVRLPQQVAIKVLRDRGTDPSVVQRFRQEAEITSRINHDRVARVTDFGFMTDGRAFLVMEYVNGRTLRQVLEERGSLSFAETANMVGMVAEGLHAAHRLGIVHRDLKPDNVMVVDDDEGGVRIKVLDFGIAKLLSGATDGLRTVEGFAIGTPTWMSPEQLLGKTLDGRSDVYGLALLAFAMLTGERAFTGATEQAEMLARLSEPARPLAEVRADMDWPDQLQALFDRTLVRDPAGRPETAPAFARELRRLLDGSAATAVFSAPVAIPTVAIPTAVDASAIAPSTETVAASVSEPIAESATASTVETTVESTPESAQESAPESAPGSTLLMPLSLASERSDASEHSDVDIPVGSDPAPQRGLPRRVLIGGLAAVVALIAFWMRGRGSAEAPATAAVPVIAQAPTSAPPGAASGAVASGAVASGAVASDTVASKPTASASGKPAVTATQAPGASTRLPVATPGALDKPASKPKADANSKTSPRTTERSGDKASDKAVDRPTDHATDKTDDKATKNAARTGTPRHVDEDPSFTLTKLVTDADERLSAPDAATRRAQATELLRDLSALLPRLRTDVDRGWANLYIGASQAILGDMAKACSALRLTAAGQAASAPLKANTDQLQRKLRCSR